MRSYWTVNPTPSPLAMFDVLDRHFAKVFEPPAMLQNATAGPRITLYEGDSGYTLVADVPGLRQEDLNIAVHEGVLTLSGERKLEVPEGYEVRRSERGEPRFDRKIRLPQDVDTEAVEASMSNGVLTVAMPKIERARPRQIDVKSA